MTDRCKSSNDILFNSSHKDAVAVHMIIVDPGFTHFEPIRNMKGDVIMMSNDERVNLLVDLSEKVSLNNANVIW